MNAAGQVVLIALGVWLAFGVEAWSQGRADRAQELSYLRGLQAEFETAASALKGHEDAQSQGLDGLQWLMERIESSPAVIPEDSISDALWRGYVTQFFSPPDASYTDLMQSGNLGLIQSDSLRLLLGRWESALDFHSLMKSKELDGYAGVQGDLFANRLPLHTLRRDIRGVRVTGPAVDLDSIVRDGDSIRRFQLRALDSVDLRMALQRLGRVAEAIVDELNSLLGTQRAAT